MCELLFIIFAGDVTYLILVDIAKQLQPSYFCSVDLVICSCIFCCARFAVANLLFVVIMSTHTLI